MGQARILANRGAELEPIEPGHEHVAQDGVGRREPRNLQRLRAVAGGDHGEAALLQVNLGELAPHRIVVHEEDAPADGLMRRLHRGGARIAANDRREPRRLHGLDDKIREAERERLRALDTG